jgi:hypothetical protein
VTVTVTVTCCITLTVSEWWGHYRQDSVYQTIVHKYLSTYQQLPWALRHVQLVSWDDCNHQSSNHVTFTPQRHEYVTLAYVFPTHLSSQISIYIRARKLNTTGRFINVCCTGPVRCTLYRVLIMAVAEAEGRTPDLHRTNGMLRGSVPYTVLKKFLGNWGRDNAGI